MSIINNKYYFRPQKLDARLYHGYTYDITPYEITDKMIDLLYSNSFITDGLVVDVTPSSQTINYVNNPNVVPYGLMDDKVSGITSAYQYLFQNRKGKIYDNPTIEGWTIETILNFNDTVSSPFNPFFYIGAVNVGKENEIISGETIDNSQVGLGDFLSNNLTFSFDNRKSIEIRSIKYNSECYDCGEKEVTLDEFFNVPKNVESDSMLLDSSLTSGCTEDTIMVDDTQPTSGSTYFTHNFNKSIALTDVEDFHLTITYEREKVPNVHNCTELNDKFLNSSGERLGVLRIYVNCVLYGVLYDFEDIIPRNVREAESIPFVHSWGYTDNSPLFVDYGLNGQFTGIVKLGRYYTRPLNISEVCNNFTIFKNYYSMSDLRLSNCFVNLPKPEPIHTSINDNRVVSGQYSNNVLTLNTLFGDVINVPLDQVTDNLIGGVEIVGNDLIFTNVNGGEIIRVDLTEFTDPVITTSGSTGPVDIVTEDELRDAVNNEFSTYLDNNLDNII